MTSTISQCLNCKHYYTNLKCKAFKEIPIAIYLNKVDHRKPHPDDNGIRFEKAEIKRYKKPEDTNA